MARGLEDWELLHSCDTDSVDSNQSDEKPDNFLEFGGAQDGIIRSDYLSSHHLSRNFVKASDASGEFSVESDDSGWVDPGSETLYVRKKSDEFLSDSCSDGSDECQLSDFGVKNELGFIDSGVTEKGFESGGQNEAKSETLGEFVPNESKLSEVNVCVTENAKSAAGFEEFGELQVREKDLSKYRSDLGGEGSVSLKTGSMEKEIEITLADNINKADELGMSSQPGSGISSMEATEGRGDEEAAKAGGEGQRRSLFWWKMPFQLLKYCVFKVSPVCSVSVVAAVMGFVLLGRRLYKMRKKAQSLQLNVTIEDKVSQVMSRAARLNEAFSVVRGVPIIRAALPASGVNPWPVLSLR